MRIALVEDEKELALALKKGLEIEGYSVETYPDLTSAKAMLMDSGNCFDLIILDLMLPDGSGEILCSDMRSVGVRTPILVLTARDSTEDKIDLLDRGSDDFLCKPFDLDELLARARALSRRAGAILENELVLGDLRVIPVTRTAYRSGEVIELTAREFDLLLYLMRHSGKALDRSELLARVWKQNDRLLTNVVDVHVRNLRKKVDDAHNKKYIRTVHGFGYMITE